MANYSTDNVKTTRGWTGGVVYVADAGSTLPSNASTDLPSATWTNLGHIDDSGITRSLSRNVETIKNIDGDPVKVITVEHSIKYKFRPLETNPDVLKFYLGEDNVTESSGKVTGYQIKNEDIAVRPMVLELRTDTNERTRVVVPKASVSETGDATAKPNTTPTPEITIEALPDSSGIKVYVYVAEIEDES